MNDVEMKITNYLVRCAKFEFYLINKNCSYAKTEDMGPLKKVTGIDWSKLAADLERKYTFAEFDFVQNGFDFLKVNRPQYLVLNGGGLKWDSDTIDIQSWILLLSKSFAQLRNNIAHGNKSLLPSPFTEKRTEYFIDAGNALMDFIVNDFYNCQDWDGPIHFS